tara:strand:+ start:4587 stop:5054 length:468 start_codon:yes stop_codon:yes gene_type:complete
MTDIQDWLDKYGESHQNKSNKHIHWICVPVIFFSLLALLSQIHITLLETIIPYEFSNLASLFVIFGMILYLKLSFPMFVGVGFFTFLCGIAISFLNNTDYTLEISIVLFVLAWIGQFIGHQIEGVKPSFFEDLKFLLIGPAWLIAFLYNKLGIKY